MPYRVRLVYPARVKDADIAKLHDTIEVMLDGAQLAVISHNEDIQNKQVVMIDEWDSKAAFDQFVTDYLKPASDTIGIPIPEIEAL